MYFYLKNYIYYKISNLKIIKDFYFNDSLMNKKEKLKLEVYKFTKDLYTYMTFKIITEEERNLLTKYVDPYQGCGKHDLPTKGVTEKELKKFEEDLYNKYLYFINRSLYLNQEEISLSRLNYFLAIALDILESAKKYPMVSFIYQNDIKHIDKLQKILKLLFKYSQKEDYFTLDEFRSFLYMYRENFYIVDIDIFRNLNKIPKRLKKRRYLENVNKR